MTQIMEPEIRQADPVNEARTPSILVAVTVAWSMNWIGVLVSGWRFYDYEVGFLSMVVSVGVVIVGTIVVWVSAGHAAHEPDSASGPEPPRVAVSWTAGSPCGAGTRWPVSKGLDAHPNRV